MRTAAAALGFLLAGRVMGAAPAAPGIVWPQPPDPPRIRFVRVLPDTAAAPSRKPSALGRFLRFVVGLGEPGAVEEERILDRPTGICACGDLVYAADLGLRCVVRFNLATGSIDRMGGGRGGLSAPVGVAAAADGRVWATDPGTGRVVAFDSRGRIAGELDQPPGGWGRPTGIALDERRGRLWVADTPNHRLHVFDLAGRYVRSIGARGTGPGEFNFPTYLWTNGRDGNVAVCDSGNFRLQVLGADGAFVKQAGEAGNQPGFLSRPRGVAQDSDGHFYVVDAAFETVQILDDRGRLLLYFGENGAGPGFFSMPGGVCVDAADRVFVADTYNSRIQVFQYVKGAS